MSSDPALTFLFITDKVMRYEHGTMMARSGTDLLTRKSPGMNELEGYCEDTENDLDIMEAGEETFPAHMLYEILVQKLRRHALVSEAAMRGHRQAPRGENTAAVQNEASLALVQARFSTRHGLYCEYRAVHTR